MNFFGKKILLQGKYALKLYNEVKDLPIIDYHCHLNPDEIADNKGFSNIGEMWLKYDHYKWRAMRLCNVDENLITGEASFYDKFKTYASIVPKLAGNPLYYWTHLELKNIFNINLPLNAENAEYIWNEANEKLKSIKILDLFNKFKVKYVATTDDPLDELNFHGNYNNTLIAPTFRCDKALSLNDEYIKKLGEVTGEDTSSLNGFLSALVNRLSYFANCGCKLADHGFGGFMREIISEKEAENIYLKGENATSKEKECFFFFVLKILAKEYKKRNIVMQLHFSALRNVNTIMFEKTGADSGFDVMGEDANIENIANFLNELQKNNALPKTVLYTLNRTANEKTAVLTGAFPRIYNGAAWWFNDSVTGIKKHLSDVSEYSILGTLPGMVSDSRSYSGYVRFDFYRRILCTFLGELVEKGEYSYKAAEKTAKDISYYNAKELLNI